LEAAQGAEVDLLALQQAAEVAHLQQEAVRIARELDAQQLLTLLQQQEMAAQQEQVGGQTGQCEVIMIVLWLFCFQPVLCSLARSLRRARTGWFGSPTPCRPVL
jgi:hypothetical protein